MKGNSAKICVPVCVQRAIDLAEAINRAAEVADIVELRLDCLAENERETTASSIADWLNGAGVPTILTLRSAEQGGHTSTDYEARRRFWSSLHHLRENCSIDLELDLVLDFTAGEPNSESWIDWSRVICSHHYFVGMPSDLDQIYERMAATPARILKIAVQADDATDCLPIFHLLERAQREGRDMIAIAMGEAGVATRILGPSRGAFLTFGSLDHESETAPGQLTARELREVYRIDRIDRQTEIMGLVGGKVTHSISPQIHNAAFAAAGSNAVYIPFEVHDVKAFMRRMVHPRSREIDWKMRGLSVTAPHKNTVIEHLDWVEPAAKEIGAVNTIVVEGDELHGYNTDAEGFITPLRKTFGGLKDAHCAVIGAGGAARSAVWALKKEAASVSVFARDLETGRPLAEKFAIGCYPIQKASFAGFDIVVNATPIGTRGDGENETPVIAEQLRGVRLVYDLVYNPAETKFMREGRAAGAKALGGLEMLIAQAVEQYKLWIGRQPESEVMRDAAIRALANQ